MSDWLGRLIDRTILYRWWTLLLFMLMLGVALALWMSRGGGPAVRYCEQLYEQGGTPAWAIESGLFHDRASCEEWYRDAADDARTP
jgi:hypothetical protein